MRKFSVFSVLSLLCLLFSGTLLAQGPYKLDKVHPHPKYRLCGPAPQVFTDDNRGAGGRYDVSLNDTVDFYSAIGTSGVIEVKFTNAQFAPNDTLYIYSIGPGGATLVDKLYENETAKHPAGAFSYYTFNGDDTLRFVFITNAVTPKAVGWDATVREASAKSKVDLLKVTPTSPKTVINSGDTVFRVCAVTELTLDAINAAPMDSVSYSWRRMGKDTVTTYKYTPNLAGYSYQWVSNDGNAPVTNNTFVQQYGQGSVQYSLRVTSDNCVLYDTLFRVNVAPRPNFSGTSGNKVLCEGMDTLIIGNVVGGTAGNADGTVTPTYSYTTAIDSTGWTALAPSGGFSGLNQGNQVRVPDSGTAPGSYQYRFDVKDNYGCTWDSIITITVNKKEDPGADLSQSICADNNAYDLDNAASSGKSAGGVWHDLDNTGFLTDANAGTFNAQGWMGTSPTPMTARFSYYLAPNPGCDPDSAIITITAYPEANAGTGKLITLCNTETAFDMLGSAGLNTNQVDGYYRIAPSVFFGDTSGNRYLNLTAGGNLTNPSGYVSNNGGAPYNWTYIVNNGICPADTALLRILVNETGNPGGSVTVDLCSGGPVIDLRDTLTGTPDVTGTWTITGAGVMSGTDPDRMFDPAAQTANGPFTATYTVKGREATTVCADTTATVTINFQISPQSGTANPLADVCTDAGTKNLFDQLTAPYDNYGTWTDDDNLVNLSGTNQEIIDLNSVNFGANDTITGNFTYTVSSSNTICNTASTTVQLRFTRKSNAGLSRSIVVCENSPNFFLIDSLGGSADPTTTFSGGPTANYNPTDNTAVLSPVGLGGTTFVITATDTSNGIGCPDATANLTITVQVKPEAGPDSDTAKVCITEPSYDLKTLLDPQIVTTPTGYWTVQGGALPNPLWLNSNGTVSIDGTGGNGFPGCGDTLFFDYHDTTGSCIPEISTHGLFVRCIPDAGDEDSVFVCSDEALFDLFPLLHTSDTTGKFVDIKGSGGLSQTPNDYKATFDPTKVNANDKYPIAYVIDNNPCTPPDTAFLYIYVSRRPRAGVGDSAQACEDDTVFDLYEMLTQNFDRKGKWYLDLPGGFDPNINQTVNSNRPAYWSGADSNLFNVTRLVAAMKGTANELFTRPVTTPAYIRFKYVASDTTNFGPNPPLCPDSVTTGILEISKKFSTPTPKSLVPVEICKNTASFNLNTLVNNLDYYPYSPKDKLSWSFSPAIAAANIDQDSLLQVNNTPAGTYTGTLTITTAGCDPITVSGIQIKIVSLPDAGISNSVEVCAGTGPVNIQALLNSPDAGGTLSWVGTPPPSPNGLGTTTYTPQDGPGTYNIKYTVVKAACPGNPSSATATIKVLGAPDLPSDQSVTICAGELYPLKNAIPNYDQTGKFSPTGSGPCATTVGTGSSYNTAVFDGTGPNLAGEICPISYCVDNGVCPEKCITINITVNEKPFAGADVIDTVCSTVNSYDLVAALAGPPAATAGGTFSAPNGVSGTNFNPTLVQADATTTITYSVSAAGCPDDQSTISLFVEKAPLAGTDAYRELCANVGLVNLTNLLNGQRDSDGTWTGAGTTNSFIVGHVADITQTYNSTGLTDLVYTYSVVGNYCPNDQSELRIKVVPPAKAGRDTTVTACQSNCQYNLFNALGTAGTDYDAGGTWRDNSGNLVTNFVNPCALGPGTYNYTYTVTSTACPSAVAKVTFIVSPTPNAGLNKADTIYLCASSTAGSINFGAYLSGAQSGGVWSNHTGDQLIGLTANGDYVPLPSEAGKRTVIKYLKKSPGCQDDTAFFKVAVNAAPAALADPNETVCNSPVAKNLNAPFGNTGTTLSYSIVPMAGTNNNVAIDKGALKDSVFYPALAGNGKFVITVTQSNVSCPSITSKYTITVVGPGNDTSIVACTNSGAIDMVALTQSAGISGVFAVSSPANPPAGILVGSTFFPNKGVAGVQYTVDLTTSITGCSASAKITVVDTITTQHPTITNTPVEILCDINSKKYQVRFKIVGGFAPYSVAGTSGNLNSATNVWTSDQIPFGSAYDVIITSAANCGNLILKGSSECGDIDGDLVFDINDLDDDNDGLPDVLEAKGLADAHADIDGNGIPNYRDAGYCTSVGGTMVGAVCNLYDFDGDQAINQMDLDSDNDGISDLFEGFDTTAAVTLEGAVIDGKISTPITDATPADGWHDPAAAIFTGPGKTYAQYLARVVKTTPGIPDFLNLDSDGDTIADFVEGGKGITNRPPNTDGNDNMWDFRDLDSDGDLVADKFEGGMDNDPMIVPNSDSNGLPDFQDSDADNDGMKDGVDSKVTSLGQTPEDFDGDGLFNFQDIDSDNDLILDIVEKGSKPTSNTSPEQTTPGKFDYTNTDSDGDNICDIFEGHAEGEGINDPVADSDGDGTYDYMDTDSDGDLIPDEIEGGVDAGTACGTPVNTDGDRDGYDFRDEDSDNDGLLDNYEAGSNPSNPRESGDDDNIYDFQDTDSDGDCIPDAVEAIAPYAGYTTAGGNKPWSFLPDADVPDYLNLDSDGDGLLDSEEAGPDCATPRNSDTDVFPDFRDKDSDNDGVSDRIEKDGDCDGDGKPNYQDAGDNCDVTTFIPEGFSPNGDGTNDYFVIPDIAEFPSASVKVFNRWGGIVFESEGYNNRWDGKYNGEDVPQGTYFYLVDLGIGQTPQKGYIYINR